MALDGGDFSRPPEGGGDSARSDVIEAREYRPGKRKRLGLSEPPVDNRFLKRPQNPPKGESRRVFGSDVEIPLRREIPNAKTAESTSTPDVSKSIDADDTSDSGDKHRRSHDKAATDQPTVERVEATKPPKDRPLNTLWMDNPRRRPNADAPSNPYVSRLYDNQRRRRTSDDPPPTVDNKVTNLDNKIRRPPLTPETVQDFLKELGPDEVGDDSPRTLDPTKYQLRWYEDPTNGERKARVFRRPGADVPKRKYDEERGEFPVHGDVQNLIKATYSPPHSIDKVVPVDQEPLLPPRAKEYADARARVDKAHKQRQLLTSASSPEKAERVEQELRAARRDLTIASEKLGHTAMVLFVRDQYGKDASINWIDLKTGKLTSEEEMINNVGGGRNRFDAACIVTKKDGTSEVTYIIGEGKGGKQGGRLSHRWDTEGKSLVQQGTNEYVNTIIESMIRRGGVEKKIAMDIEYAQECEQLKHIHVHGHLKDTPDGQMFFYSGRFFDISERENNE